MASVRITTSIIQHARNAIHALFAQRLKDNKARMEDVDIQALVYRNCATEAELEALQKVPPKWLSKTRGIRIRFQVDGDLCGVSISGGDEFTAPTRDMPYYSTFELTIPADDEVAILAIDVENQEKILVTKRAALEADLIDNILCKCSTLRQALEAWPSVLEFMPPEAVQRHRAPTARSKAATPEITVSEETKAELIKARMQNGN